MEEIKYLPLKGNEELVHRYFDLLASEEEGERHVLSSLRDHCNLESYFIDGLLGCEFSESYTKGDEDDIYYFGKDLVGISYSPPVVEEEIMVVLNYEEFYAIAEPYYLTYADRHKECREEILNLLRRLKRKILKV